MNYNEMAKGLLEKIKEESEYNQEVEQEIKVHKITHIKKRCGNILSIASLGAVLCLAFGSIAYPLEEDFSKGYYYKTNQTLITEEETQVLPQDYMPMIDTGRNVILLEFGPWEKVVKDDLAPVYHQDVYSYNLGDVSDDVTSYLDIDTSNLEGTLVDERSTYIPNGEDTRALIIQEQDLNDKILTSNEDNLTNKENIIVKSLKALAIISGSVGLYASLFSLYNYLLSLPLSMEERNKLQKEYKQLKRNYRKSNTELRNLEIDLINLLGKYSNEITDEEVKEAYSILKRDKNR